MTSTASRLRPFGTTIFAEMSRLAVEHDAVNLGQGFPDFDAPAFLRDAARHAVDNAHNQYARSSGVPALNRAIASWFAGATGREVDPDAEITVTSGCTEAIAAAMLGLVEPGDRVVVFEPFYDCYRAAIALAGGEPVFVTLHRPDDEHDSFWFDHHQLARAMDGAELILLNTPHNPTGKVFSREELGYIAALCVRHGVVAIADEVYERLVFADRVHVPIASLDGMHERTLTLSSLGKTFSCTGWKIGWSIGPPGLTSAVRSAHQFLTFATCTPMQHAAVSALGTEQGESYIHGLLAHYTRTRRTLVDGLGSLGFDAHEPEGAYFVLCGFDRVARRLGIPDADDKRFCMEMIRGAGVVAIPPSVFYGHPDEGRGMVRFAFCKESKTIDRALDRLGAWINAAPGTRDV